MPFIYVQFVKGVKTKQVSFLRDIRGLSVIRLHIFSTSVSRQEKEVRVMAVAEQTEHFHILILSCFVDKLFQARKLFLPASRSSSRCSDTRTRFENNALIVKTEVFLTQKTICMVLVGRYIDNLWLSVPKQVGKHC